MFVHEGPGRSERQNRLLAGYLAAVGGYVNSVGFVLIGTFTSHVTGNVGRFSIDLATNDLAAASTAFAMIGSFMTGAFVASMMVETNVFGRRSNAYATALLTEAALLLLFTSLSNVTPAGHPRLMDMEAALLCAAMGMQNSLVTRLSGAVVRTTHLTGALTDMAIELARWFRWSRDKVAHRIGVDLSFGENPAERPSGPKIALLGTIIAAFIVGAMFGAVMGTRFRHAAMVLPCLAVASIAGYAVISGRSHEPQDGPSTRK